MPPRNSIEGQLNRAAMVEAEHACHGDAPMKHGQDIRIFAKRSEHRAEQRLGKHRCAEIADARGIYRVVHRPVARAGSDADFERVRQPFAYLGALLARDGEQLRFVVRRQRGDEPSVRIVAHVPAQARFGQNPAAQFDGRAG